MFFKSYKKGLKLTKISKVLAENDIRKTLENFRNGVDDTSKGDALKELFEISQQEEGLRMLLGKYNIDFNKFVGLYTKLKLHGAGQWIKGHYVAASSLVYGGSLEYLLRNTENKNFDSVAFRLIKWFENKESGQIKD